jgi:hypothetical protein
MGTPLGTPLELILQLHDQGEFEFRRRQRYSYVSLKLPCALLRVE